MMEEPSHSYKEEESLFLLSFVRLPREIAIFLFLMLFTEEDTWKVDVFPLPMRRLYRVFSCLIDCRLLPVSLRFSRV